MSRLLYQLREGEAITRNTYQKFKKENPEAEEQEILFLVLKSRYYMDNALNDRDIIRLVNYLSNIDSVINFIVLHDYYEQTLLFFPKFRVIKRTKDSLSEMSIKKIGIWDYISTLMR